MHAYLNDADLRSVIDALEDARFPELPVNLATDSFTEIEVGILDQRKTVVARSTFTPAASDQQAAFAEMLAVLRTLPSMSDR